MLCELVIACHESPECTSNQKGGGHTHEPERQVFFHELGNEKSDPDVWVPDLPGISRPKTLCLGCFFLDAPEYYEARNDYTNNSETILLCNRCMCV